MPSQSTSKRQKQLFLSGSKRLSLLAAVRHWQVDKRIPRRHGDNLSISSLAEQQIDNEKHHRDSRVSKHRHLPDRQPNTTGAGRFVCNEVETAEPAIGIGIGLFVTAWALDHLYLVSPRLRSIDKLVATQSNDENRPDRNKKVTQEVDEVSIGVGKMVPISDKHKTPKVVALVLNVAAES